MRRLRHSICGRKPGKQILPLLLCPPEHPRPSPWEWIPKAAPGCPDTGRSGGGCRGAFLRRVARTGGRQKKKGDEEYSEINLSGLDKLTIEDAVLTVKKLTGDGELAAMVMPETSTAYTDELAAKATDLPIEFFKLLPIGASKKVRQMVQGAITVPAQKDESDTRPHILHLHKPYLYKGETHTEVDLSGVGSLTGMNIRQAENRMEEEDIRAIERTSNYYYCCLMASMATGKDVKFFLGLPLCEAMPLKNAVNDKDFFE